MDIEPDGPVGYSKICKRSEKKAEIDGALMMEKTNPRYDDWQSAMEIICSYRLGFEDHPNAVRIVRKKIRRYFKKMPGPIYLGWVPPSRQEIDEWTLAAFANRKSNKENLSAGCTQFDPDKGNFSTKNNNFN